MSTLAIKTGLIFIQSTVTTFTNHFAMADDDRQEFSRTVENLIDALEIFEKDNRISHQTVEFYYNALLDFFDDGSHEKQVFELIFRCLYRQITKNIDDFEHLLNIHAQKQYLLEGVGVGG
jgi:hypothetical protein